MFAVALIGADGAGKTTIAEKLMQVFPFPIKYLYMGLNIDSSNIALPTSRLINFFKQNSYTGSKENNDNCQSSGPVLNARGDREIDRRGKVGAAARLLFRLTEEFYRQIISWYYQARGYIVIYDRHFLFDFASPNGDSKNENKRLSDRLHWWFLNNLYPKPDLTIFLDAPEEILFERKGEATLEYLRLRREAFIEQEKRIINFIRIDATKDIDSVLGEVTKNILEFHRAKIKKR